MSDDFDQKILAYPTLSPAEQHRLRLAAVCRARELKSRAAAGFFKALFRGVGSVFRVHFSMNDSGRTSATSISRP
jgi:hypothetical protein